MSLEKGFFHRIDANVRNREKDLKRRNEIKHQRLAEYGRKQRIKCQRCNGLGRRQQSTSRLSDVKIS